MRACVRVRAYAYTKRSPAVALPLVAPGLLPAALGGGPADQGTARSRGVGGGGTTPHQCPSFLGFAPSAQENHTVSCISQLPLHHREQS